MKIRKINNIITILIIILVIILFILIFGILNDLNNEVSTTTTLDTIENYNYKLTDTDTEYFKENFKQLKKILESDNLDEEEYAKTVTKLFIIDFYSLKSAINKNDVGGIQFVKKDYQETFIKKAKDTIYKSVENNMYNDRKQVLPNVKQVEIVSVEKNNTDDIVSYKVISNITYDEDLGYAKKIEIILSYENNTLQVCSLKEGN